MDKRYGRVLIKVSGESLSDSNASINFNVLDELSAQIASMVEAGTEVGVLVGGGNILRGGSIASRMRTSASAHTMGMLSTAINAIALEDVLVQKGLAAKMVSAIAMEGICDKFSSKRDIGVLESGGVLVFACGTGLPFFTTDTAAAMRAAEIGADALLLAKNCDYVYSSDPKKPTDGKELLRFSSLCYDEYIERGLGALDLTCVTFCKSRSLPIVLFGRDEIGLMEQAVMGENPGTLIYEGAPLVYSRVSPPQIDF